MKFKPVIRVALCVSLTVIFAFWSRNLNVPGQSIVPDYTAEEKLLVLTVATEETSGLRRFIRSAKVNGLPFKVFGLGQKWLGYGQKLLLLKEQLETFQNITDQIVLYADAYDVLFNADAKLIADRFKTFNCSILFSAEKNCWPNQSLASRYPPVENGLRYLNAGLFIGYADDLYRLLTTSTISTQDDDQLFVADIYLNEERRRQLSIKLDHRCEIFQNLYDALPDVQLRFNGEFSYAENVVYNSSPLIIHANGKTVFYLETLSNYIPKGWNPITGCLTCRENTKDLSNLEIEQLPSVLLAIFLEKDSLNIEEFFLKIGTQTYPKSKMYLFLHNAIERHSDAVNDFINNYASSYSQLRIIQPQENVEEGPARELALQECIDRNCSYYFSVDSVAQLDHPLTLKHLIEQNRPVIAPLLVRRDQSRANFWSSLPTESLSSLDYTDIVSNQRRGLWNVAYVTSCYLVSGEVLQNPKTRPTYVNPQYQSTELAFCASLRSNNVDVYVSNRIDFGYMSKEIKFGRFG